MIVADFIQHYVDAAADLGSRDRLFVRVDEDTIIDATVFVHRRWLDLGDRRAGWFQDDPTFDERYRHALGHLYGLASSRRLQP